MQMLQFMEIMQDSHRNYFHRCQTILLTTGVFLFILVIVYIPPQASVCEVLQHLADQITWSINTHTHFSSFSMFFNRANLSLNYQITHRVH